MAADATARSDRRAAGSRLPRPQGAYRGTRDRGLGEDDHGGPPSRIPI